MQEQLHRTLTLPQLVFYGVGTMVGAGIYSVVGTAAGEAGTSLWVSFILAGIAAFLTALSYAELASMYQKAGAEYQFLKNAFPRRPLLPFMAGYMIALHAAATSATVALAFAGYLNFFIGVPSLLTALLLLTACTVVNIAGIKESTWVSIGLICIEVAGLLVMIWSGFESGGMGRSFDGDYERANVGGIFTATALIFFIYIGFEDVANLSEETKEPGKNVPRALIISVILTSILYVLVAFSVIAISDPVELARSRSPLSLAAGAISPWRGGALAVAALFATASTALISLIAISRMLFGMAREGDMPKPLARINAIRKTPWVAALVLFGAACALLPLGEVKTVASISSFGVLLVFAGVHAAMIVLRLLHPEMQRPFRVPFSIGRFPLLPPVGILIILSLLTQFEPIVYFVGGGAIVLGLIIHFIMHRRRIEQLFVVAALLSSVAFSAHAQSFPSSIGRIKVTTVARSLEHPWSLAFLPDGRMLVTERAGRLRIVSARGSLSPPLSGVPKVYAKGQGGLLDIVLDPDFDENQIVYFSYAEETRGKAGTAVAKAVLSEEGLRNVEVIFRQQPMVRGSNHWGSRLVFARDGTLFVTLGDRFDYRESAQNLTTHLGKVVRIKTNGSIPPDNPFAGRSDAFPEIWSYGHRNMQGAALNPQTGALWTAEHGPRGGDEINIDESGKNYGWPKASYGSHYEGIPIPNDHAGQGFTEPAFYWNPSISPSGMIFYTGNRFNAWYGDIFVGALSGKALIRLHMDNNNAVQEERLLQGLQERIRDVRQGPDGLIYLLTDSDKGRLLRVEPE